MSEDVVDRMIRGQLRDQDTIEDICRSAKLAMTEWLVERQAVSTPAGPWVPTAWLRYEFDIWELGEAFRRELGRRRAWRKAPEFLDLVAWVLRKTELDKGRQPFVEFAAKWDADRNREIFSELLSDPGVRGHVIDALRSQRIPGYSTRVRAAVSDESAAWIRKEAKRYLELGI